MQTDARAADIDVKINKLEGDLKKMRDQMNKMPNGSAKVSGRLVTRTRVLTPTRQTKQKSSLKNRAMILLKQKKMYEQQRDQMVQQSFNMDQANFTAETLKTTIQTV